MHFAGMSELAPTSSSYQHTMQDGLCEWGYETLYDCICVPWLTTVANYGG